MSDFNATKPCQCGKLMILVNEHLPRAWWQCCQCGHAEEGPILKSIPSNDKQIELLRWRMANLVTPTATNTIPMGNRARVELPPANGLPGQVLNGVTGIWENQS